MSGKQGRFLGVPYDWRRPNWKRLRARAWDPGNPKVIVPKSFGLGYGINLAAFFARFRKRP